VYQVADALDRVVQEHTRAGVAHHGGDALAHVRAVAVNGALTAGRLVVAVGAGRQAGAGVGEEIGAVGAERIRVALSFAVQRDHGPQRFLFCLYAHIEISSTMLS